MVPTNLLSSVRKFLDDTAVFVGGMFALTLTAIVAVIWMIVSTIAGIVSSLVTFIGLAALFIIACVADLLPDKKDKP